MPKASELKRGSIVQIDGAPHILEDLHVQTPSARGGASLYKCRFRNLATRQKLDRSMKGDEMLGEANFEKREVQYLYCQGDAHVFMDLTDYSQFELAADAIDEERYYLVEDMEGIFALVSDGKVLSIELPPTVELEITETSPAIKGASATARTKPATLSTGLTVHVPEHISTGTVVRVDTRTGAFLGRA